MKRHLSFVKSQDGSLASRVIIEPIVGFSESPVCLLNSYLKLSSVFLLLFKPLQTALSAVVFNVVCLNPQESKAQTQKPCYYWALKWIANEKQREKVREKKGELHSETNIYQHLVEYKYIIY